MLREEHILTVSANRMLRGVIGPGRGEAIGWKNCTSKVSLICFFT